MRKGLVARGGCSIAALFLAAGTARAELPAAAGEDHAFVAPKFALQLSEPESVYAPMMPPREDQGTNEGAAHFDLALTYFTDYVYRGIELFEPVNAEDRTSLQIAANLSLDLGKLPHPFIGVFVNYSESDPISSFQEIRPIVGAEWTIRPIIFTVGHNAYLYPDRDDFQTSEVWTKVQLDDSFFFGTDEPIFSPYIYGAYDYDLYDGWYFEAGVSHDFRIEDTGLTLTAVANVSYVRGMELFEVLPIADETQAGFQHYQVGLIGTYSLNNLLNFSPRYGEWSLRGHIYYTDGIDDDFRAETQLWGGGGIMFEY